LDRKETAANLRLADLKPKTHLKGRITKIELFGAFVDVGLEREGLVHISMLKKGHVNRVEDVVKVGDEVDVWVHKVDMNAGRLELTMIPPVALEWGEIRVGMRMTGKVVRLEKFGAFVDIGAERSGLVHVSEMTDGFVSDPSEIAHVGDEVEVKIVEIDRKKRQIRLSMKEDPMAELEEVEVEEPAPTAMEYALRKAMDEEEGESDGGGKRTRRGRQKRSQRVQDDIMSRTLEQRLRTASSDK
jgi:small subunit ribosomal protein S1